MQKFEAIVLRIIYALTFTATFFFTFSLVVLSISTRPNAMRNMLVASILALIFGVISLYLKKKINLFKNSEIDLIALKIAMKHDGLVTASELASYASISLKRASNHLELNYLEGYCEKKYTQNNLIAVYHYKTVVALSDKLASKDILDIDI